MRADPDLSAPQHLSPILEADGLVGALDPLPVGHVLALITDGRRRVRFHTIDYLRCSGT